MAEITVSLKHDPSEEERACGGCGASFVPAEDAGSRVLGLKSGPQAFDFVLCGGCHSKWSHGTAMRLRSAPA